MTSAVAPCEHSEGRDLVAAVRLPGDREETVTGRVVGPRDAPLAVVLGGVSAHRYAADAGGMQGWWREQAQPGGALDVCAWRLLSLEFLGEAVAPFPTTQDQARAILALVDALGVERFRVIGASYGGMVALALAALAPSRVVGTFVTGAAAKASQMARASRSTQRAVVEFGLRAGDPKAALALARRMAMTTYRTAEEFERRFGENAAGRDRAGVAAYLAARGQAYAETTSAERFLALSQSLDEHQADVTAITGLVHYAAVTSDRLVPAEHMRIAAERTPKGVYVPVESLYGHDAFLVDHALFSRLLNDFLAAAAGDDAP